MFIMCCDELIIKLGKAGPFWQHVGDKDFKFWFNMKYHYLITSTIESSKYIEITFEKFFKVFSFELRSYLWSSSIFMVLSICSMNGWTGLGVKRGCVGSKRLPYRGSWGWEIISFCWIDSVEFVIPSVLFSFIRKEFSPKMK